MSFRYLLIYLALSLTGMVFSPFSIAADKPAPVIEPVSSDVLDRLDKLEHLLQSQGLLDMLQQLDNLQNEVNQLRGQIEVQNHTLEQLKKRQRDIYTDIDRRMQRLESGDAIVMTPSSNDVPPLEIMPPAEPITSSVDSETEPTLTIEQIKKEPVTLEQTPEVATIDDTGQAKTVATQPVEVDPIKVQAEYQQAFKLLKQSQYDRAIKEFGHFLNRYPDSQYSDNAQYWLSEAYYVTRRYEEAIVEYNKLVSLYPDSQKVTHSLLKIGYSHQELGQIEEAKKTLTNLREYYPGTTAARLADDRLRKISATQ